MKHGVLAWIKHRLGINDDPEPSHHLNVALKESDELTETKRAMIRYSRDLEAGTAGKVLPLKQSTMEKVFRGPEKVLHIKHGDFLDDELFGEQKERPQ